MGHKQYRVGRFPPSLLRREGRFSKKAFLNGKEGRDDFRKNTIMADKQVLERMLSMLPEEFQDIYYDTIPEAKEIRSKMVVLSSEVRL